MTSNETLVSHALRSGRLGDQSRPPLADRMRPNRLEEIVGQKHLLAPGKWLHKTIVADRLVSLIFWGPPGVGKTTLARVISNVTSRNFIAISAVLSGVSELRAVIKSAEEDRKYKGRSTLLFVDEIHRFNKSQQDALLPHVEAGTVTLIGATTENPSFAVNAAILSRARALRLRAVEVGDLVEMLERALSDEENGYGSSALRVAPEAIQAIAKAAAGDARRALGLLEAAHEGAEAQALKTLNVEAIQELFQDQSLLYDRDGEEHYNLSSALIKSLRGSDPDAALYYLLRMLKAGEDPLFLLRRLMIFASEDVGNADPRGLQIAQAADAAFRKMGMPEGIYPLSHACLYLASCPKSGAVKAAINKAQALIEEHGALPVPLKLRNAPTRLMKDEGYGADYRYAHDFEEGFAPGETYLPEAIIEEKIYQPTRSGLEQSIRERLERIEKYRRSR